MTVDSPLARGAELHVYTDGASRGNPGEAACAYVFATPQGERFHEGGEHVGRATNNEAEYRAVLLALSEAAAFHDGPVVLHSDSELVVKQLAGEYRVNAENLQPLHGAVLDRAEGFADLSVEHVPREHPGVAAADRRCNEVLDAATGGR